MADIKTKNKMKGTIKTIDKSAVATEHMKSVLIQTREKAEYLADVPENSAEEYASNRLESGVDRVSHETAHQFDKQGRKGVQRTKQNIVKTKDGFQKFKEKRAAQSLEKQSFRAIRNEKVKAAEQRPQKVKQFVRPAEKEPIKAVERGSVKTAQKSIKNAKNTSKAAVKTSEQAVKTAHNTVKTAKRSVHAAKTAAASIKAGIKTIITAVKSVASAVVAGGWISVLIIIVTCLICLIFSSAYGIFFSGEDLETEMNMKSVIDEINTEYDKKLEEKKISVPYDVLEIEGGIADWKEVLAVYAVKVNTDPDNPQEVVTMNESKKQILKDIFWDMNEIFSKVETKNETVIIEEDDGHDNIIQTEKKVLKTYLYITVSHKTADEMANRYGFNQKQKEYVTELVKDKNNKLWSYLIENTITTNDQVIFNGLLDYQLNFDGGIQ